MANTSVLASFIEVGGGVLTTVISFRYGPSLAKKARRSGSSESQVILRLQRSIQKRDKTISYLESKVKKEEANITQLKALNEQLRVAQEKEMLYIEDLQRRAMPADEIFDRSKQTEKEGI